MALLEKLMGTHVGPGGEIIKIPVHQFYAALAELSDGAVTRTQIEQFFGLDAGDTADMDFIIARYQVATNKEKFSEVVHRVFMLAESNTPGYNTRASIAARLTSASS